MMMQPMNGFHAPLIERHPDDLSADAQAERLEAYWCQIVLLNERIKRLEADIRLRDELIALLRDQQPVQRTAMQAPAPQVVPKKVFPCRQKTVCACGQPKGKQSPSCRSCSMKQRWERERSFQSTQLNNVRNKGGK